MRPTASAAACLQVFFANPVSFTGNLSNVILQPPSCFGDGGALGKGGIPALFAVQSKLRNEANGHGNHSSGAICPCGS